MVTNYNLAPWANCAIGDPQAHIDALVDAGVLRPLGMPGIGIDSYVVVQPHKHEWRVLPLKAGYEIVTLYCFDSECEAERRVPNRLPIEEPV